VKEWLFDSIIPGSAESGSVQQFRFLLDGLRNEILIALQRTSGDIRGDLGGRPDDIASISSLCEETRQLVSVLTEKVTELGRFRTILENAHDFLWLDSDELESLQQLLGPRAESLESAFEKALRDAVALELSISVESETELVTSEYRRHLIEQLWEEGYETEASFSEDELAIGMKEAKAKYDLETFRKWKRARKKAMK